MGRSGSACGASSIVRAGRSHVIYKLSGVITLHCLMTEMMFGHTLMSWDKTITACEVAQRDATEKCIFTSLAVEYIRKSRPGHDAARVVLVASPLPAIAILEDVRFSH